MYFYGYILLDCFRKRQYLIILMINDFLYHIPVPLVVRLGYMYLIKYINDILQLNRITKIITNIFYMISNKYI